MLPNESLGEIVVEGVDVYRRILRDGVVTGYLKRVGGRPIREVYADACAELAKRGIEIDEYLHSAIDLQPDGEWPANVRWVACYPVTGGSEGHYVHVDLICAETGARDFVRKPIMLGKTFRGMAYAAKMANALAEILGA